ncbi:Clp protease N-terminal domain-containing protein [Micromonospora fluostatini]|uniref:Clp protease N-terminal domain-containing protein n=1 Tax=Micromonospora sp. JCM 30529 TaxID=3421643 RepID=UPI003D179AAA
MPKINVYLPDDLADAVRDTALPVSAICQRALEQAVRRVTAIRQLTRADLAGGDLAERLPAFTARARTVLATAAGATDPPGVDTAHLLAALLDDGQNLALHVLRAIEVDPARLRRDLDAHPHAEPDSEPTGRHVSGPAAAALQLTLTEATALGHNYVGCEHLLLGLVAEPDGVAGQVLRAAGAEPRLTRRAVAAALAGYVHLRAQTPAPADPAPALTAALDRHLRPLLARVERLEQRLGPTDDPRP